MLKPIMTRRLISSGSPFEAEIGYSRAVLDGDWVFVSGTTGFDYAAMTIADAVEEQTEQCLRNIDAALREAGATLADTVCVTYVLPDAGLFPRCWPVLRRWFGEVRPAAMMISAGLADPRMKIEIELTARKRGPKEPPMPAVRHVVFHHPGPLWQPGVPMFHQPGLQAHVDHYRPWLDTGKLALGGPFMDAGGGGMMVSQPGLAFDEVQAFALADPCVQSGLLLAEVRPWFSAMQGV